jgi:hypothetical protein
MGGFVGRKFVEFFSEFLPLYRLFLSAFKERYSEDFIDLPTYPLL